MFEQNVTYGPGTGTFINHSFEILIMLGVAFLLGLWLGWVLWSRYRQMVEKMRMEYDSMGATASALRAENDALKGKLGNEGAEVTDLRQQITLLQDEVNDLQRKLKASEQSNLELLESTRQLEIELGLAANPPVVDTPPIEIVNTTIDPETGLDFSSQDAIQEVLDDIGANNETDLSELNAIAALHTSRGGVALPQLDHNNTIEDGMGVEEEGNEPEGLTEISRSATESIPAHQEETAIPAYIAPIGARDDLKIVEGIGPKIESLLFDAGIHTYTELASTPVNQLKDILQAAGSRYAMHDPGTWSAQALLAANGEWENLKAYQEFLDAGKKPKH